MTPAPAPSTARCTARSSPLMTRSGKRTGTPDRERYGTGKAVTWQDLLRNSL